MGHRRTPHGSVCVIRRLFNSNSFATSAALVEVCALLSAILASHVAADGPNAGLDAPLLITVMLC